MSNSAGQELWRVVKEKLQQLQEGRDFYWEGAAIVFTSEFHRRRGYCCGSGCRHCPYDPPWIKDTVTLAQCNSETPQ
ncbi:MAG: hypothetical protein HOP19_03815 [Acidobacteria bacterium]|nr:hypothetical protein [Acidobacteriota bacterium]